MVMVGVMKMYGHLGMVPLPTALSLGLWSPE